jgi:hypothetical protein
MDKYEELPFIDCTYVFICGLFNDAFNSSDYIASNDRLMNVINYTGYGRKRYCPDLCLEEMMKAMETFHRIVGLRPETEGRDFPKTKQEFYWG